MENLTQRARDLIRVFKGDAYVFGPGAIAQAGALASRVGHSFLLVRGRSSSANGMLGGLKSSFDSAKLTVLAECTGAAPNSPVEDIERVRDEILAARPDAVVALGGGSLIDAAKGSAVLAALGGACEDYFGAGKVTEKLKRSGRRLLPIVAVQTASGSAAHLTKYANVTDMRTHQKKLFIDPAVVPPVALFDYRATLTMPGEFTTIGAFDGICHLLEVYSGTPEAAGQFRAVEEIALTGLELIVGSLPGVLGRPADEPLRERVGLGTDLGGYAIMIGSTNGPHLNSFSLVDVMDHGQAVALLAPYYICFFAPAIEAKVRALGRVYRKYGYVAASADLDALSGRALGEVVGRGMMALAQAVGFPTALDEIQGFGDEHVERMLSAAKDPTLASKLAAMPIPMRPEDVDRSMAPILRAARAGDLSLIPPPER